MRVNILRKKAPEEESYWESFQYTGPMDSTVAGVLDYLNYNDDIFNEKGERTARIGWDCSCLQGICGACAMVINGQPALACETFLKDLKRDELTLQPLKKFPVLHDLITDRSSIHDNFREAELFIGEYQPDPKADFEHQYSVSKCLKCGLCMEVCPNYTAGKSFFGAAFANDCYLVSVRNKEKSKKIGQVYAGHFGNSCSKSLSCMDVCPMEISIITSIAKMNR